MSGGVPIPPPPPPVDPTTIVPPANEVVVDLSADHATSPVTVNLDVDHPVVVVHDRSATGVPVPPTAVNEPVVRRSDETTS